MRSIYNAIRALIGLAVLSLSQPAGAAGFYISEIGTPGSLGTAGVANPVNRITADSLGPIRPG